MEFLILFLIAAAVSAVGFKKFIYFISLGYGFSIAVIGIAMLILFRTGLTPLSTALCLLLALYGCRLGGFLLVRELKSASYRKSMKDNITDGSTMKLFVKVMIWLSCALLYVCEAAPVLFRLLNGAADDVCGWIGLAVMLCGIVLESASDLEKNRLKKKDPNRFCDTGLFAIVRCPNYLGEVLCWTGVLLSGITVLSSPLQWVAAIGGWVCIVYIMFGGARRLELRQNKRYGSDPDYQAYVKRVPILLPGIPLYSVARYKWLVG